MCSTHVYNISIRKLEGKTSLGRPRHRKRDVIKTDLQKLLGSGLDASDAG
jgi:hypothetical protein